MASRLSHVLVLLALTPCEAETEWAVVGGACQSAIDIGPGDLEGVHYIVHAVNAAACKELCDTYQTDQNQRCYGIEYNLPAPSNPCKIWIVPVLGSDDSSSKACEIPFGEVISMQMVFEGINTFLGAFDAVDTKIEESIRTQIANANSGVAENMVSVRSTMSNGAILGRFVLPKGTDTAPILSKTKELGPQIEESITSNQAVALAITMPGSTLSMGQYDAWIWGNQTAEAENEVGQAFGSCAIDFSLLALVGLITYLAAF